MHCNFMTQVNNYVDISSMVGLFLLVCLSQASAKPDNVGRTSIPVLFCKGSCLYWASLSLIEALVLCLSSERYCLYGLTWGFWHTCTCTRKFQGETNLWKWQCCKSDAELSHCEHTCRHTTNSFLGVLLSQWQLSAANSVWSATKIASSFC